MANDSVAWLPLVTEPIEVSETDAPRHPAVEFGLRDGCRIDDRVVGMFARQVDRQKGFPHHGFSLIHWQRTPRAVRPSCGRCRMRGRALKVDVPREDPPAEGRHPTRMDLNSRHPLHPADSVTWSQRAPLPCGSP
jgi:hypothetical protein